jgi:endonuclease YncB( thermonuclease family)
MFENKKIQIRISEELLNWINKNTENTSLFIRDAIREKIESGLLSDPSLELVEVRCRTPYTYFAKLDKVIDGDTLLLDIDVGFFMSYKTKVRLAGIDCPAIDTDKGKLASEFITIALKDCKLLIETRKKEKYGRYLAYIYYHPQYTEYEDIMRFGKLLNDELVKEGLANLY